MFILHFEGLKSKYIVFLLLIYYSYGNCDSKEEYENDFYIELNKKISAEAVPDANKIRSFEFEPALPESCNDDIACIVMTSQDRLGLDAIRSLHRQLDDDADGAVDLSESNDFLREELKYENGAEKRQKAFHMNDDMQISLKELWDAWIKSEVHNWTVEQTAEWLRINVELPQYAPVFINHRVTGAHLPRLATVNGQYISNVLGIKDVIHKQKIMLKAMDVVLFGSPKTDFQKYIKDLILITLLFGALACCYYAYMQNSRSKGHLNRMIKDMESLQKAELDLKNLQKELELAKQEQEYVITEKQNLEKRLLEQNSVDGSEDRSLNSSLELSQLRAEIETLRHALQRAEGELVDRYWSSPPHGLQLWLQVTHEIENKSYSDHKATAEKQLQIAREACEKLKKKRSSLVGAFVSTHGKSIDEVDRSIVDARTALKEVTQELAERVHRWKQMEDLCGFNIINNKGLAHLENILYRSSNNGRNSSSKSYRSNQDNADYDSVSNYSSPTTMMYGDRASYESGFGTRHEGQDSSDSDKLDHDEEQEEDLSHSGGIHFTLGNNENDENLKRTSSYQSFPNHSSSLKDKETITQSNRLMKSISEDVDMSAMNAITPVAPAQNSSSGSQKIKQPPRRSELVHSASVGSSISAGSSMVSGSIIEDDTCSTDSSSININEEASMSAIKHVKNKHKLRFLKFTRKFKNSQANSLSPPVICQQKIT